MHDVVRDVAITIAYVHHHVFTTRNDIERDWKDRDKLKKCTKIFLPNGNTIISQLWPNDLDCPNLEYVSMSCTWNSSFKIPKDFFAMMPKLRVLNVVGLQQSLLPSSIGLLTNLQTLCLDNSKIKDVVVIGKLKKLKVLSLRGSCIEEFPMEMSQLTQLRLLDLSNCYRLKVIVPNVISKLSNLEELYLKRCRIQWKIEELEDLELLLNLTSVELDIEDDKVLPKTFFSRELIRYKISVGSWWYPYLRIGEQECLRILKLIYNSTIYLEELCGIKNVELLCITESFYDHKHSIFNLQSNEITTLFNKKVIFSDLKVLVLVNIISRKIWDNQLPSSSFQNLKELILWRCTKIKFVFPYTITKNLQQLQHLEIKDCIDLEEIVAIEEITEATASFVFPEVTFLKLKNLPKLESFYPAIHTLEWPKLEKLAVEDCDKFNMLNSEPNSLCLDHKINHDLEVFELDTKSMVISWNRGNKALKISRDKSAYNPLPVLQRFQSLEELKLYDCEYKEIKSVFDLPNLNVLHVEQCSKLVSLVPSSSSMARSLVRLKELNISDCGMLAEILENKRDVTTIEIVFQKLTKLSLDQLESLTCFCSGNHSLNFPSLEKLIITECPNMNTFFREISSVSEFTLQSNEITPFFNQKVHFHDLKVLELKIIHFEKIWDNQLLTSSYQNLTHLSLFECDKIKYVFPLLVAKSLQQLQYLELTSCKVLERIVAPEEGREATINFFFPLVSTVKLQYLPEFADFYPGIHTSEWPKLKELVVNDCGKLKMLTSEPNFLCFDQKINHDLEIFQLQNMLEQIRWRRQSKELTISFKSEHIPLWLLQRFENLACLSVSWCKLVNLTTPLIAKSLVQLRKLKISNCAMLVEILEIEEDATIEIVFENLSELSFDSIESLMCFCSGNYTLNFPSLEELNITECPNMKTFCRGILSTPKLQKINYERMEVENEGNDLNKTIQGLYKQKNQDISLDLNLKCKTFQHDNSMEIVYNQHPTSFYQNLTHLFLWKCGNIKYAFPSSIAKILHQLQQLKIQNCKALEEIVAKEDGANAVVDFVFPNITLLKFEDLPELTAFYPGLYALEMPKLKKLVVKDCTKYASLKENNVETELNILAPKSIFLDNKINHDLEIFQLENGWEEISWWSQFKKLEISRYKSAPIPLCLFQRFQNLTCLFVDCCCELVNLTTPSTARSLVQLRELKISCCEMLMEILEIEEDATTEIVFENLNKLSFERMENLTCFCSGNYAFNFCSLKELNIAKCHNIKTFCRGILNTPKLQKISYEEMKVEIEGNDLNKTIQELYKKKNQDISLDLNLKCKAFHHDNSMEIVYNQHPTSFYQNLTHLFLWKCGNIKYAFPSSIAKILHQLQQLKIQNCKALEEIVAKEDGANAVVDFVFPNITLLKFEDLPELTAFYPGLYALEMPKLKELVVEDCTKYASLKENNVETGLNILAPKSIFLDNKINHDLEIFQVKDGWEQISWWSRSKKLKISYYESAPIPLWLLQRFENLTCLCVYDCNKLVNLTTP